MTSSMVRLHETTKKLLEKKASEINKGRKKANKKPMTYGDVADLAIRQLTVEQGVDA